VSTAEHPDALTRRLELLAGASGEEAAGESSVVAELVRGLRAEIGAVRAELGSLRSETGAVRSDLDGLGSRVEQIDALARDGASTAAATLASLEGGVADLGRQVETESRATADLVVGRLREITESGLSGLETALLERLGEVVQQRDDALRGEVRAELQSAREQAAQDRADMTELAASVRVALDGLQGMVEAEVEVVRAAVAETGTEVAEVVRSVRAVTGHVGDLHEVVTRGVGATQEALTALSGSTEALAQTVEGFRTEWPTRTYEVVQGARAVADGVVREVRAEVSAQLERVRRELDRAAGGVDAARDGLDAGTDRLSRAGAVLVAYLEQRDRLLEAERDSVLHDVLDTFAAGLSPRDRSALAGRVGDAVSRRRDGRDAERYRAAVGTPVSPAADLPEDLRRLAQVEPAPARPSEPPAQSGADELDAPEDLEPPIAQDETPPPAARVRAVTTRRVVLPRGAATRGASGTSVTVRPTTGPAHPASTVERPTGSPGEPVRPGPGADRRARVDVMPQVRSPEVALEAAAPTPPAPTPPAPAPPAPAPPAPAPPAGRDDADHHTAITRRRS